MKITRLSLFLLSFVWAWMGLLALSPEAKAAGGRTLLKANMVRGFITVYVNGKLIGRYGLLSEAPVQSRPAMSVPL